MFRPTSSGAWVADMDDVRCYFYGMEGPDEASIHFAEQIAGALEHYRAAACRYLDLFVDRAKASGSSTGQWSFLEVEIGIQQRNRRPFAGLAFDLPGDDGGYWMVTFREASENIRPFEISRRQG